MNLEEFADKMLVFQNRLDIVNDSLEEAFGEIGLIQTAIESLVNDIYLQAHEDADGD